MISFTAWRSDSSGLISRIMRSASNAEAKTRKTDGGFCMRAKKVLLFTWTKIANTK